ncbi:hypothetical protein DSM104299_01759 [Baekduia alba]|uniref:hypothetical protein n=1 Tax=Baekduia alba TaxID=2997333 RepID=UPI00233F9946|nr:hypothetical protein [Baekduia alba]WCB93057.1 hypothetical protein DSM104299_01759 [Baekduia alba]
MLAAAPTAAPGTPATQRPANAPPAIRPASAGGWIRDGVAGSLFADALLALPAGRRRHA